jgi:hypothetical protein
MTKTTKIVLGVFGGLFILAVIVISAGAYMVMSAFRTQQVSPTEAGAAFTEARARFPGVTPAFSFDGSGRPEIVRQPPSTPASVKPSTVHILVFDEDEGRIARINLPISLLKMTNAPIEFEDVELKIEDVERYGSTVLLDGDSPEGDPILIWTD